MVTYLALRDEAELGRQHRRTHAGHLIEHQESIPVLELLDVAAWHHANHALLLVWRWVATEVLRQVGGTDH